MADIYSVTIGIGINDSAVPENIKNLIDDLICESNPSTEELITLLEEHNVSYDICVVINTDNSIVTRRYTLEDTIIDTD